MEAQPRGRSPSGGRKHISPVPSPHNYQDAATRLDPSVSDQTFTTGRFNTSQPYTTPFLEATASQPQQQTLAQENNFYTNNQFNQGPFPGQQFADQNLNPNFANPEFMFQGEGLPHDYSSGYSMNPFNNGIQQTNVNPADLSKMSSPHDQTSPNLLSPEHQSSQPGSPASTNGQFYTPQHSRHQSLDPAAAYQQDSWQNMNFPSHHRAPSDHSDISSNGTPSYVSHHGLLQSMQGDHSPYLAAQTDAGNSFAMENISLSDQQRVSPAHSPYVSPRLLPQQNQGLGLGQEMGLEQPHLGAALYPPQPESTYPAMTAAHGRHTSTVSDMGQADQFAPPIINIEPAPVSRQGSFGPDQQDLNNTLSPPGSRGRSKSDVTNNRGVLSRSASPLGRHSETLSVRSHSPASRGSSPGPDSGRIEKNRRASTSSVNSRDYILDLADPNRPAASGQSGSPGSARAQKHPATFQCHLCPKRFTRAYNLRSHLRTHTDERPFVCTVCGKAFARQHDRKRHESLHSGEKKFVCKGELRSHPGQQWGCGRRFARADALGRHFRSEAGRVCIRPLLDEEAAERRGHQMANQAEQLQYAGGLDMPTDGLQPVNQSMMIPQDPASGLGGFSLPAALLAQYPALQNIDWTALAQQQGMMDDDDGELSDMGQRTSFDAAVGQGGEYFDDGGDEDTYNDAGQVGYGPGPG